MGDLVAFLDAGAYTLDLMTPYNARPRAGAWAITGEEVVQIRAPETYADLVALDRLPR